MTIKQISLSLNGPQYSHYCKCLNRGSSTKGMGPDSKLIFADMHFMHFNITEKNAF